MAQLFKSVNVYVIWWFPTPAIDGLNTLLPTPFPEYDPKIPDGVPPLRKKGELFKHTSLKEFKETVGRGFTVTIILDDSLHDCGPIVLVTVTVYVVVDDGFTIGLAMLGSVMLKFGDQE